MLWSMIFVTATALYWLKISKFMSQEYDSSSWQAETNSSQCSTLDNFDLPNIWNRSQKSGQKLLKIILWILKRSYYFDKIAVKLSRFAVKLFQLAVKLFQFAVKLFQIAVKVFQNAVILFQYAVELFQKPHLLWNDGGT